MCWNILKGTLWGIGILAIASFLYLALFGWRIWAPFEFSVLSWNGMHHHTQVYIRVRGERVTIPADIGISQDRQYSIHTHDETGYVHMEFPSVVMKKDTRLKNFFDIWGKQFSKEVLFENRNGEGGTVRMSVNGVPNNEYEGYHMQDGDEIVISFE